MYTPSDLREKTFKNGLGFDKKDVEQFITEVSSNYELLLKENEALKKTNQDLTDSISYYKSIEKTLQKALVIAEKTAQDIKSNAYKEAEAIELEARSKANLIQSDARQKTELLEHKTLNLIQQYDYLKIHFQNLLNAQLELLNSKSFSINTSDFTYQEELQERTVPELMNESSTQPLKENTNQLHFDFPKETSEASTKTEDDFEFINLKDEIL